MDVETHQALNAAVDASPLQTLEDKPHEHAILRVRSVPGYESLECVDNDAWFDIVLALDGFSPIAELGFRFVLGQGANAFWSNQFHERGAEGVRLEWPEFV